MTPEQARNIVAILQRDPMYYRNFGIWWWHIKAELKRHGYGTDQLYLLGDYDDESWKDTYQGLSPEQRTKEALEHQAIHLFHKYNNNTSLLPTRSGGGVYVLYDGDAE